MKLDRIHNVLIPPTIDRARRRGGAIVRQRRTSATYRPLARGRVRAFYRGRSAGRLHAAGQAGTLERHHELRARWRGPDGEPPVVRDGYLPADRETQSGAIVKRIGCTPEPVEKARQMIRA